MRALADAAARHRIETDLDATLVVEAAAGTGKTTALVGRILALVRAGRTTLDRIVAVTFTEKAAGEMKIRLRTGLEQARADAAGTEADNLERALRELEAARIGTIHGFCRDLLGERPVEAGIDPLFEVAADGEAEALFGEAFEHWFPEVLADPPEGVRRMMRRPASWTSTPRDQLRGAGWRLAEHRDHDGPWRRDPFDREGAIDALIDAMADVAALAERMRDPEHHLARGLTALARWLGELELREATFGRDHDALEAQLRRVMRWKEWNWRGFAVSELAPGLSRDDVLERRDGVKAELDRVVAACDADMAACLHVELRPLVERYEALKKRAGRLDFLDLLLCTRDLLASEEAVREELQGRFDRILVDEFQDTDPLQVEIVFLLASDDPATSDPAAVRVVPGKLFVVGDPKQSIYRFRRADIAIYAAAKRQLLAPGEEPVQLSVSFRSDPRIQAAVNAAFEPVMTGGTQAGYVPLNAWRDEEPGRPAVVALPVPEPYGRYGKVYNNAIEDSLPRAVAGWIDWLIHTSGWLVQDVDSGEPRPVRSSDVCLLFKRFRKWGNSQATDPYVHELELRGVPHVLVGGRTLHDREEVAALRTALTAVEWPDDQLSVYATLRGPLFALTDGALLEWKATLGSMHPLRPLDEGTELSDQTAPVAAALAVLKELHRGRNRRPVADTVGRLLDATRAHAGFANWSAGDQVLANVLRVAELGRRFEASGGTSFRAFVEHLADEAERGESAQAPVVEEGTEGVRLMTVHKAKGLQFPVVVLCDITATQVGRNPSRHVDPANRAWFMPLAGCVPIELLENAQEVLDRDREESHRLLYVASTRSRDILVAPGVGDGEHDGWVDLLNPALYPKRAARKASMAAPGCPSFGADTVAERTGRARPSGATVRPGLHTSSVGTPVVWWDPTVLPVAGRASHGLRRHWLLSPDPDGERADAGLRDHETWRASREARLEAGATPTLVVASAREKAEEAAPGAAPTAPMETTDAPRAGRPSGKRFGALVHACIAEAPLDADAAAIDELVALHGRLVGADAAEADACRVAVASALRHPLLVRAAAADELRREAPVAVVADGELVEGTLDLAFREGDAWTVVELKTSLGTAEERAQAEVQLDWYVRAVAVAAGASASGVILMV